MAPGKPGKGPFVISDEIYHGLVYEGKEHSILEFTPNAFVLERLLQALRHDRLAPGIFDRAGANFVRPLQKMHQNFAICAPVGGPVGRHRRPHPGRGRRGPHGASATTPAACAWCIDGLTRPGAFPSRWTPTGAFYVLHPLPITSTPTTTSLAFHILEETAAWAWRPGRDFGEGGKGFLRFSYCQQPGQHRARPGPPGRVHAALHYPEQAAVIPAGETGTSSSPAAVKPGRLPAARPARDRLRRPLQRGQVLA